MKTLMMFSSIIFLTSNHPISMCMMIVLTIFLMSIYIWKIQSLFLSFYIVSMIFIGGMMILFIYISSIAPNTISSPLYFSFITFIPIIWLLLEINGSNENSSVNMSFSQSINQEFIIISLIFLMSIFIMMIWMTLNPLHSMKSSI